MQPLCIGFDELRLHFWHERFYGQALLLEIAVRNTWEFQKRERERHALSLSFSLSLQPEAG